MLGQQAADREDPFGQPGGVDPVRVIGIARSEHHLIAAVGGQFDIRVGEITAVFGVAVGSGRSVALIGHHLRVSGNPVVGVERGAVLGGGTWETMESTATVANLYDWGTVSGMPYFGCAPALATGQGDIETAAEAFDRALLYPAAAFDIYGRLHLALLDPLRETERRLAGRLTRGTSSRSRFAAPRGFRPLPACQAVASPPTFTAGWRACARRIAPIGSA